MSTSAMGEGRRSGGSREERTVCRLSHFHRGKWTRREEEPKYAPDRTCDVEHLRLEVRLDLPGRSIEAVCRQTLRAAYGPVSSVVLDARGLDLRWVRDAKGRDLPYDYTGQKLTVRFPDPIRKSGQLEIAYGVVHPSDGLFFHGPNEAEPEATWQLWSQGEDEGARHWIPCHDAPNERMTIEVVATAPELYTVISNGALLETSVHEGMKTWHFREGVPIPSYLITLVAGVFTKIEDRWRDIPVEYYVEPGREAEGRRSFGRTPEMLEFFTRKLEAAYPYEKYAQVAVRHFHFGGMENASATTQTETTMHDERAALDFESHDLVAHELVHQWFGDLVTCKSWTHAWLNEGFATYFESLWKEEDKGREEFDYEMLLNAADYMAEDYRRPIASPRYRYPFELFDMHLYPKGGWVLHMLRRLLGEELFWKGLRLYLQRHSGGVVETIDLIRALEDASGRNLTGFFDQWIFSPGHPELEGELSWESDHSRVKFSLKQTQKREDGVPLFRLKLRLDAMLPGVGAQTTSFEMDQAEQTFYWALPAKPSWVVFDPEGAILRESKIKLPSEWIESALTGKDPELRVIPRVDLVRQLGEEADAKAIGLLGQVLREDSFWGVQAEAAKVLSRVRTPEAGEELLRARTLPHPKARKAVVIALGKWRDPKAAEALLAIVRRGDPSYFVQREANAALGHSAGEAAAPELKKQLAAALKRRDWRDQICMGAAEGLAATRDETAVDDLLALARDLRRYWQARLTAIRLLADLGAARPRVAPRIAEELVTFLEDPHFMVASRMPDALVTLGEQSVVAALRRKGESSPKAELREACLAAAEELAASTRRGEEVDRLRGDQEKLRDEIKQLKETLESIKAKVLPEKKPLPARKRPTEKKRPPERTSAGVKRPAEMRESPEKKTAGAKKAVQVKKGAKKRR